MMARMAVLVVLAVSTVTQAFVWPAPVQRMAATALTARPTTAVVKTAPLRMASDNEYVVLSEDQEREAAREKIQSMIDNNGVCLFMKGNKLFPMCGFSNTAVQVLRAMDAEFDTFDVLSDPWVRDEIKKFSNWPTIPQVYIGGEFVGGSDILLELYESGELKEILDKAKKA